MFNLFLRCCVIALAFFSVNLCALDFISPKYLRSYHHETTQVALQWSAVSGASSYIVRYQKEGGVLQGVQLSATNYTVTGLSIGTYWWDVIAFNASGNMIDNTGGASTFNIGFQSGDLIGWGRNVQQQTGQPSTTSNVTIPQHIHLFHQNPNGTFYIGGGIKSIATGAQHSACVDSNGYLWVWGHNSYGQLGLGASTISQLPRVVFNNTFTPNILSNSCEKVFAHGETTFVLTIYLSGVDINKQGLYATGSNSLGQTGITSGGNIGTFYDFGFVAKYSSASIIKIDGGLAHSVLSEINNQTSIKRILTTGGGAFGQLLDGTAFPGHEIGTFTSRSTVGTSDFDVAAGRYYTITNRYTGGQYGICSAGDNSLGQLGNGNPTGVPVTTLTYATYQGNQYVSTSTDKLFANYDQTAIIKNNNNWSTFGANSKGQLGLATSSSYVSGIGNWRSSPLAKKIAFGDKFALLLDTNDNLYVTGDNTYGQHANGTTSTTHTTSFAKIIKLEDYTIKDVAAGEAHSIALIKTTSISAPATLNNAPTEQSENSLTVMVNGVKVPVQNKQPQNQAEQDIKQWTIFNGQTIEFSPRQLTNAPIVQPQIIEVKP